MEGYQKTLDELESGKAIAVEALIERREEEDLFLDYKLATTQASDKNLNEADQLNLAKAISGFGNGPGGLILWGVDCRRVDGVDTPTGNRVPVPDVDKFRSMLDYVTPKATRPAHSFVRHIALPIGCGPSGYVLTVIPPAPIIPLSAQFHKAKDKIYMRAGSAFMPVPFEILSGLFGHRPRPKLVPRVMLIGIEPEDEFRKLVLSFDLKVLNAGRGLAGDIHIVMTLDQMPMDGLAFGVEADQDYYRRISSNNTVILSSAFALEDGSARDKRIVPTEERQVCTFKLIFTKGSAAANLQTSLAIDISIGSENSASNTVRILISPELIKIAVDEWDKTMRGLLDVSTLRSILPPMFRAHIVMNTFEQ